MRQSRLMSAVEAVTNVVVGYLLAVATQVLVFPLFGLDATLRQSLGIGAIFTLVSLVRGYFLRRLFDTLAPRLGSCVSARSRKRECARRPLLARVEPERCWRQRQGQPRGKDERQRYLSKRRSAPHQSADRRTGCRCAGRIGIHDGKLLSRCLREGGRLRAQRQLLSEIGRRTGRPTVVDAGLLASGLAPCHINSRPCRPCRPACRRRPGPSPPACRRSSPRW